MVEPQASGDLGGGVPSRLTMAEDLSNPGGDAQATALDGACVLVGSPNGDEWLGREHRRLERFQVQASRPIALRLLDGQGQPQGRWMLADILDISRGGLCLLLTGPLQLPVEQHLQMDVRSHPDFGSLRMESQVRWCRSSTSFTTLGIAFLATLPRVPRLEIERRGVRRDPNTEDWALE